MIKSMPQIMEVPKSDESKSDPIYNAIYIYYIPRHNETGKNACPSIDQLDICQVFMPEIINRNLADYVFSDFI